MPATGSPVGEGIRDADDRAPAVQLVDPSAYTPPYDRSLAAALAAAGAEVELVTSRFLYGPVLPAAGFAETELFYRHGPQGAGSRARAAAKLVQHPLDMHRLHRGRGTAIARPDVRHFQWVTVPHFDALALRRLRGPVVVTAHDVLPREPRLGQVGAQRRLYAAADAVVCHSQHGRDRLIAEAGVPADRIRVIAHGAFDYLTRQPDERPLDSDLAGWLGDRPTVLFFGLLRPYKGVDVLLDAWRRVGDPEARLVVAGMPRMATAPLHAAADERVRFVERFVTDPEIPALFRRADVVVLPYRQIEQSGVLYTALAFGRPCVLSRVGGFEEVATDYGAARLVEPGDPEDLAAAISELVGDRAERERLAGAARRAADGPYSWDRSADDHLALYRSLIGREAG